MAHFSFRQIVGNMSNSVEKLCCQCNEVAALNNPGFTVCKQASFRINNHNYER